MKIVSREFDKRHPFPWELRENRTKPTLVFEDANGKHFQIVNPTFKIIELHPFPWVLREVENRPTLVFEDANGKHFQIANPFFKDV